MVTTVATPCAAYNLMAQDWQIIDDLLGGTREMREKQTAYLPKEVAELDANYANRLSRSYLKPALRNAVESGRGAVFRYEVSIEEVHPQLQPLMEDVDLLGNDITAFLGRALGDELSYGHCHLLAAYPTMNPDASLADAQEAKARPYGVRIDPRNVFSWKKNIVAGYEKIAEVRFFERVPAPSSEWDTDTFIKNVTVLRPGEWQEWSKGVPSPRPVSLETSISGSGPDRSISTSDWQIIGRGEISVADVPWTVIYADRVDFFVSRPPFLDLAMLNLAHWQVYSDYKHILHVAQVPLLFCKGMAASDSEIVFGVSSAIRADDPAADIKWVELTGKSIESGRTELQDLEAAMEKLGAALLSEDKKQPGNETATAVVLDTAQEQATLGGIVRGLEDGANAFLWHMGQWLGIADAGKIRIRRPIGMGGVEGKAQVQDGQVIVEPKKPPPNKVTIRQKPARWDSALAARRKPLDHLEIFEHGRTCGAGGRRRRRTNDGSTTQDHRSNIARSPRSNSTSCRNADEGCEGKSK